MPETLYGAPQQRFSVSPLLLLTWIFPAFFSTSSLADGFPFTFEDEAIQSVLKKASELTGISYIFDPEQVQGKITILAPEKVSLDEAQKLLRSALAVKGYALQLEGGIARVVPAKQAVRRVKETLVVVPLDYAEADILALTLQPITASYGLKIVPYYPTNSLIISGPVEDVRAMIALIKGKAKVGQ